MSKENKTPKPTKEEKRAAAEQAKAEKLQKKEGKKQLALANKQAKLQQKRDKRKEKLQKKHKKKGAADQDTPQVLDPAQNAEAASSVFVPTEKPTKRELRAWTKETRADWKALTREERRLRTESQLNLERQLIAEGKIRPRGNYRPRGAFWRMFSVMLAFFFGIFGAIGGLAGTFVHMATVGTTRQLLESFNIKNVDQLLTEKYYNLTPLRLAQELAGKLGSMPVNNLETFAEISPLVTHYLDIATQELKELGVNISSQDLAKVEFTKLSEYIWSDVVPVVELGSVLQLNTDVTMEKIEDHAMFYTLCYGTFGTDYEIDTSAVSPAGYSSAEGEAQTGGRIKMLGDSKPTTMNDLLGTGEGQGINNLLNKLSLGSALGLDINVTEQKLKDSSTLYTLCYGTRGDNFDISSDGRLHLIGDTVPTTFGKLIDGSASLLDDMQLGAMLGLDTAEELQKRDKSALMYALAYGTEGVDFIVTDDYKIVMQNGKTPTTVGELTDDSTSIVNGIVLDSMLEIDADSDAMMRYIAYGPEMAKGMAFTAAEGEETQPWEKRGDEYYDAEGKRVDEYGYLLNDDGSYLTENIIGEDNVPTEKLQYVGGGKYVIKTNEDGTKYIEMLPDPNDETKTYAKKTLGDLTDDDAKLLDGMKIGDIAEVDENSSGLMRAIKDWSIDDLKNQDNIDGLLIGDVMEIKDDGRGQKPENVSNLMWALRKRSIGELNEQETINGLKLGEVMQITDESSGIMKAMKDWSISELGEQERIDRLHLGQVIEVTDDSSELMKAMQNWRISDLTKQEKIDSLTLGQVLKIDESDPTTPRIMKSLKGKQIGDLGGDINTMRLSDILDESDFEGNKILRNLKMSSLKTLSKDVQALSVKDVFGDELYSYMKLEETSYLDMIKAYDPTLPESTRPELLDPEKTKEVETYHMYEKASTDGVPVSLAWFDEAGNHYENGDVYRGTRTAQGVSEETEYYYYVETRTPVIAETEWQYMDYTKNADTGKANGLTKLPESDKVGKQSEAPEGVEVTPYAGTDGYKENDEQLYYFTATKAYPLLTDGYDVYYTSTSSRGDTTVETRIELEKIVTGYTGKPVDASKVLHDESGYYVIGETEVTQKWCDEDFTVYDETDGGKVVEHYRMQEGEDTVELDRCLAGVWALLFAKIEYDDGGTGKVLNITDKTDKEILSISEDITKVSSVISTTALWKLYLFNVLTADPSVPLDGEGIVLYPNSENKTVHNLNECTVVDCIELVRQLTEKLPPSD